MEILLTFFAGAFAFNAIPHLVKGISGQTHMTPFKRVSSPMLNIFWAFCNIFLAVILLNLNLSSVLMQDKLITFLFGGLFMAAADAWLFGRPNARLPWHKD